jgi:hypothetical protein
MIWERIRNGDFFRSPFHGFSPVCAVAVTAKMSKVASFMVAPVGVVLDANTA